MYRAVAEAVEQAIKQLKFLQEVARDMPDPILLNGCRLSDTLRANAKRKRRQKQRRSR